MHALPPGASLAGRPHVLRSPWLTPCGLSSSLLYPATRALSWKSDDAEFRNAIRADVLLRICRSGVVFLPGAAGTVQEVFQAACENYYAGPADVAPMVLVGRRHWTALPVWPLLQRLAQDRAMEGHVHLVDEVDDVPALLADRATT